MAGITRTEMERIRQEILNANRKDLNECAEWLDRFAEEASICVIGPQKMQIPVRYNDIQHTLTVLYWYNDYSFGAKSTSTNEMTLRLVVGGAFLDVDMNTNLLPNNYNNPVGVNSPWLPIVISTTLTPSSQASV